MRPTIALLAAPLALAALAGCARTETPEQARQASQAAQAEYDRLAAETRGENGEEDEIVAGMSPGQINTAIGGRLTPGSWSVAMVGGERTARFGEGEEVLIAISCEIGGGIDIRLPGMPPQGGSETVYISSPEGGSTFTASEPVGDAVEGYISVPASDPFIGRLIAGNGPFSLRMGSDQRLTFPASDELTGVVSACDRQSAAAAEEAEPAAPADRETAEDGE